MEFIKNLLIIITAATLLSSCEMTKQGMGTGAGAVGGALLGSQFGKGSGKLAAVGLGALAGAFIGGGIGKNMDDTDKLMMQRTSQKALENQPSGSQLAWKNPDNGNRGTITPTKTYQAQDGRYCREFTQTVMVGGKKQEGYGTACRQPDGSWQITQ